MGLLRRISVKPNRINGETISANHISKKGFSPDGLILTLLRISYPEVRIALWLCGFKKTGIGQFELREIEIYKNSEVLYR